MFYRMEWDNVYKLWKQGGCYLPQSISEPLAADPIFVEYNHEGFIYGYDWLSNEEAINIKQLIKDNPKQFLYFTQPTNKGTIYTAQMLVEATNPEEIAAIWIAATAFELINTHIASGIAQYANELYYSAVLFLRERFYIWHHAMRKLVPDVLIPYDVLNSIQCENAETVMGLIQMNVLLLKSSYAILCYSSISDTELEKEKPRSLRLERQS